MHNSITTIKIIPWESYLSGFRMYVSETHLIEQ